MGPRARFEAVGRPLPRAATRRLAAGRGKYVDDIQLPRMLHAAFLRSPYPHARIARMELGPARSAPGVAAVYAWNDLQDTARPWQSRSAAFPGMVSPPQTALAAGRAAWQGEPVLIALGETRAAAEDALELAQIDWEELPAAVELDEALSPDAPPVHPGLAHNVCWTKETLGGDPDGAFAAAALVVEKELRLGRLTGVSLEPRGLVADWEPALAALTVHHSHQMPHQMQAHFAEFFGLAPERVRIIVPDVGGGFGVKMHVYPDEVAAVAAAIKLARPVKFIADRLESLGSDIHAREHAVRARMALDAEGRILGFEVGHRHGAGAYSVFPRGSPVESSAALHLVGAPYAFAHFRGNLTVALQNKAMTGQYRSVGHPIAVLVTERLVDAAARARGEDPLALRRRNFTPAGAAYVNGAGQRLFDVSHAACVQKLERLVDLPRVGETVRAARAAGRALGFGVACYVEMTATGAEAYGKAGVPVSAADSVSLSLELSGAVHCAAGVTEIGQGVTQALAQAVADAVGVPVEQVLVHTGDTAQVPHGGGAWASRGAAIGAEAAWLAGRRLRENILQAAARLLGVDEESLDVTQGRIVDHRGEPRLELGELARVAAFKGYEFPDGFQPQLSLVHHYRRSRDAFLPANGVQAALVEVDLGTGLVRALRHWAVCDCGRVVNPLLVEEQLRGGIVQGIGEALYEELRYGADGHLESGTLAEYLVPMAAEMPDIELAHVQTPYAGSSLGAKGAGEAGVAAAPAAILNAVNDALAPYGAALDAVPITPTAVLAALSRGQ
jgi:carbon-monoxide dehydrogenase large subunit